MSDQVMNDMNSLKIKQKKQLLPHPVFDHFGNQVGMYEARKELNISTSGKIILFFGFIRNYKGLDVLLEAMANPTIVKEDISLLVAGEFYEDEKKYTDLIESLKLTDKVFLHNHFISEEKIKYYFSATDVLVQPYRHATQSGVTPLAFHFNLPMIVTNVGGLKEMVVEGKTGLVTEPNADAIANGINEYFQHGKNAFTENLKEHKNQYSWAFMAKGIIQLADEIIL
jgi:glycosyltransferase involved in cell wall biosynthesis